MRWWVMENVRAQPSLVTPAMAAHALDVAKDRHIRDLEARVAAQEAQLAAQPAAPAPAPAPAPVATAPPPRLRIRVHAPRAFSGVANDKGVYDPTP